MKKILFADDLNFSEKSFPGFYANLQKYEVSIDFDQGYKDLKKEWGNLHSSVFDNLPSYDNTLEDQEIKSIIQDEVFYFVASLDDFVAGYNNEDDYWEYCNQNIHLIDRAERIACFWYNYWSSVVKHDVCVVFGGNTIYTKALMLLCQQKNIPCYVMEHSFTGNDYYFSMQYEAIPNSPIASKNANSPDKDWVSRFAQKNNKNVKPTVLDSKINFSDYVLILCQVKNDFSVIAGKNRFKNLSKFYVELINHILDCSEENVVVKCHPYEDKKVKGELNYDYIYDFIMQLPEHKKERVSLVKNFNLEALICDSKCAITLTSQSGLEAVAYNKPVITFKDAFYSNQGFTIDLDSIADVSKALSLSAQLNFLDEAKILLFNRYMAMYFGSLLREDSLSRVGEELILTPKAQNLVSALPQVVTPLTPKKESLIKLNLVNSEALYFDKARFVRLARKLKKDPKAFAQDSSFPILRKLSKFI